MEIQIEKLEEKNFEEVAELIVRTNTTSNRDVYPLVLLEEFAKKYQGDGMKMKAKEIDYWIAKMEDGTVIGVIGLKDNQVRTFFVDPDYQGRGIGRQLYEFVEEEAERRGLTELHVEATPTGEPVYAKFGFVKQGVVEKERAGIRYQDAVMLKKLA